MPLTSMQISLAFQWAMEKANPGTDPTTQKGDVAFVTQPDVTVFGQLYQARWSFTAGSLTGTIDLRNFLTLAGEGPVVLTKVCGIIVIATGCAVTIAPGAANGLAWFLPAAGLTVKDGGCAAYFQPAAQTVDATHRNLDLTAVLTGGVTTGTLDVAILGGV